MILALKPVCRAAAALLALHAVAAAQPAHGWGRNGHRIVGQIAENHLSPRAAGAVAELIAPETLAGVGTWADEIRSDPAWDHAAPWHWVTVEDGQTYASSAKNPRGDLLEALERFERVLRDPLAERDAKLEALKFLVHFLADLHQPLHVGRGADRGGGEIEVRWFDEPSNLHRVWDVGLLEAEDLSFTEWVRFIDHPTLEQVRAWQTTDYLDWAAESMALRAQVYDFSMERRGAGGVPALGYRYSYRNLPTVRERLLQAGVRLAGVLDSIFGGD